MKPAPWIKHDAGRGRAFNAHRNSLQGPCVNAARLIQKQRLDTGKAGVARPAVGLTAAHRVERLLWEAGKPSPVRKLRGCQIPLEDAAAAAEAARCKAAGIFNTADGYSCTTCNLPVADCECLPF